MAALPQQGAAPLAPLRGYPCTPTKTVHPPLASVPFLRVLLSYPGGDTIAIYHCSIKIASWGKGKSAVAAAAYKPHGDGALVCNCHDNPFFLLGLVSVIWAFSFRSC